MISNKLKMGLLAAVGAAMLTMSAAPASALTLSSSSPAVTTAGSDVQQVWWDRWGRWHPNHPHFFRPYWGGGPYWGGPHCRMTPWGMRCHRW